MQDFDPVEEGFQALADVRAYRMRSYHQPGESGTGQLYTIAHDARLVMPGEDPGASDRVIDPESSDYFMLMDDIETDKIFELFDTVSDWGENYEAHVKNGGSWEPGVGEETLYIDDPRLRMPVEFNDEYYLPLELIDLSTEGSLLVDETGRIYPFTVELNPDVYLEDRHRPGEGTKTRNARNMSAVEQWDEEYSELETLRRFPEAQYGDVDSVVSGEVRGRSRRYPTDFFVLTLSSETGEIQGFAGGRRVMESRKVTDYTSPEEVWEEAKEQNGWDVSAEREAEVEQAAIAVADD